MLSPRAGQFITDITGATTISNTVHVFISVFVVLVFVSVFVVFAFLLIVLFIFLAF